MGRHVHVLATVVDAVAPDGRGQATNDCDEPTVAQVLLDRSALATPHVDVDQRRVTRGAIIHGQTDPNHGLLVDQSRDGISVEAPDRA